MHLQSYLMRARAWPHSVEESRRSRFSLFVTRRQTIEICGALPAQVRLLAKIFFICWLIWCSTISGYLITVYSGSTSSTAVLLLFGTARARNGISWDQRWKSVQSNLGLTDKCVPTTVRCWKKSVKRKRSVPHSVTIVCTSTANIAYHNASKRGIIMSLRQRSTISRFVGYWFSLVTITCTAVYAYGTVKSEVR